MTGDVTFERRALAIFREVIEETDDPAADAVAEKTGGDPRLAARVMHLLELDRAATPAESDPVESIPDQVGAYRLLELVGEGGMGRVYRAERNDGAFDRVVAVKFIGHLSASSALAAQFEAERRIMAQLKHPNITQLLDGGTLDERAYLVMEYVDGVPFTFDGAVPRRTQVERLVRVCQAVAHAHNNLILHRDIKPDNVLIDDTGQPKLVDFGVATLLEAVAGNPQDAGFKVAPMTPQYAAPECLAGESASVASDVYSLGVLLFEVLTGARPYDLTGSTREEAYRIVSDDRGRTPATGDQDLDAIIAGAMAADPTRRYGSALGLAEELEAWLAHRPIQTRRDDVVYVAGRFARRHRLGVTVGTLAVAAIVGLLISTLLALGESHRQRTLAESNARTAEGAAGFLVATLASANPLYAGKRLTTIDEALAAAEDALQFDLQRDPALSGYVLAALADIYAGRGDPDKAGHYLARVEENLARRPSGRFEAGIRAALTETYFRIGRFEDVVAQAEQLIRQERAQAAPDWEKVAKVMATSGEALVSMGEFERAGKTLESTLEVVFRHDLDAPELEAQAHNGLANLYFTTRKLELADRHSRGTLEVLDQAGLLDSANGLQAQVNRAGLLSLLGRADEADVQYRQGIERMRTRFGPVHPWVVWATASLGAMHNSQNHPEVAVAVMLPLLDDVERMLPTNDETSAYFKAKLGYALCKAAKPEQGLPLLEASLAARKEIYPPGNWNIPDAEMAIGYCHIQLGEPARARTTLERAREHFVAIYGPGHGSVDGIDKWLAELRSTSTE